MTREEKFEFNWKRIHRLMQLKPELFTQNDSLHWYKWCFLFGDQVQPVFQHQSMFVQCIKLMCSPEQQKWWLQKANNLNIIGCYA